MKISLVRKNEAVHFEAKNEDNKTVQLDGAEKIGGEGKGIRPMQLLLMGLGGCSGIDICLILKKQRQRVENFEIEIEGEREKDKEPSLFEEINVVFKLTGDLDEKRVLRAVSLSMDKYCSVAKTLEQTAKINYRTELNGNKI